jgi:uncharacterized protein YjbI with pentapeptide repeats
MGQGDGTSGRTRSTGRASGLVCGLGALVAVFLASQIGCKEPESPRVTRVTHPERPFLYEAEFARTPGLAALPHQVVIHDLEPSGSTGLVENVSQHALDRGSYRFCIAPGDPWVRQLTLDDETGKRRVAIGAGSDCVDLQLDTGTYRVALLHDGKTIAGPHRVAFVRRLSAPSPPLVDDAGQPQLGWWALAPDDPTGQGRVGRLRAQPPPVNFGTTGGYPAVEPIVADFSSRQVDAFALFDFQFLGGNAPGGPVPEILSQNLPLDMTVFDPAPSSTLVVNAEGITFLNKFGGDPLLVVDLGNQKVQLQARTSLFVGGNYSAFFINTDAGYAVQWAAQPPGVPNMDTLVLFRMYQPGDPNLSQLVLQEGQVALYSQCNFGGQVTVFTLDTSDFSALTSSDFPIDRNTASVQVGPGTAALLYADAGFTGTLQGVEANTGCLDGTPIGRGTRSLQIRSVLQAFLATSSCEGCNLAGVDLTDAGVSGADLTNASLQGATLNHTDLSGAKSLAGTDFSGATITCSNFSGTPGSPVDLTATKMLTATFTDDRPGCRTNLSQTKVSIRSVPATALRQGSLASSNIDFADAGISALQAVSWPGATLQNAAFSGVDFSGSDLAGVQFVNTVFVRSCGTSSCTVSFQGATLDGVAGLNVTGTGQPQDFTGANFSQASLGCVQDGGSLCADLSGTVLAGAQFVGGTLVGTTLGASLPDANFSGATLNSVTGLAGADLQGAQFVGAILPGADLQGAMLDSVDFSGATIDGGNLTNATGLGTLVTTGADFTLAQFGGPGLIGASLERATLDGALFPPGADMSGIRFNDSSLVGVDLSNRSLSGAKFLNTNLTNATLAGSSLTNNPDAGIETAADFTGAHLKDVNLSNAKLQGTIFHYASLYGSFNLLNNGPPVFPCVTDTSNCGDSAPTGFTCSCATVVGAVMTRTNFTNAFLYGLDFEGSTTVINGADFSNALLVGANFQNTKFQTDQTQGGAQPVFAGAFLQGANLSTASLDSTNLDNAYVDFEPNGNEIQVVLGAPYLAFKGWSGSTTSVCVQMAYDGFVTQVPVTTSNTTCPDGLSHNGGCGPPNPRPNANPAWDAGITVDQAPTPGAYLYNATYAQGNQDGGCNLNTANFDW